MPYKKGSIAEQAGKLRRTLKRRIARLEREISKSDNSKDKVLMRSQIAVMQDEIEKSYQRNPYTHKATGYDEDTVKIAIQNMSRQEQASRLGTSKQQAKNFMVQQELNAAMSGAMIGPSISRYTREEVNIFYRATQRLWGYAYSTENRNELIMEKIFGKNAWKRESFEKLVNAVLAMNREAVEKANRITEGITYANEMGLPTESDQKEKYEEYINMTTVMSGEMLIESIKEVYESLGE